MQDNSWQAAEADVEHIIAARHGDPFQVLGMHDTPAGQVVRAFVPHAETLDVVDAKGAVMARLAQRHPAGFFEGLVERAAKRFGYRLNAANSSAQWQLSDPYGFSPVLGATDDYLLVEGTHKQLYERLGAHVMVHEGVGGTHFALWAPHAARVSVVGDFNEWDGRRHQMRKRIDSGLWEIFAPGIGEGAVYKFEIISASGRLLPLKADPFGFGAQMRPATASVVTRTDQFTWQDGAFMARRAQADARRQPVSAYEVHLGSWRRGPDNRFLSYDELAEQLVPYAAGMGFTHLELMPISEHPLDDSWGYQPIGLFAPTRRFGDPAGFARFVNAAHLAGLGIILDWVPAHFPVDVHGLDHFDGEALYEDADPKRGFHPDWNTAIYDFGRAEVANFLAANALYWLERFHIDGLRVDAVASMLYLDYSRKAGQWTPNKDGGNHNLEAVAFLRRVNELVYAASPGTMMIAEESTSWPGVSQPVYAGGLGFGYKWNMGWMNDTLSYMAQEPIHRSYHHNQMTFGMAYAFSENFVLPISHDEVVHGKGSLLGKMPGDDWQKFANLRAYLAFMWGHPGKKLLFMGQEFGQRNEWNFRQSLDWHEMNDDAWQGEFHRGLQRQVRDLNLLYREIAALHGRDCESDGFDWINADDSAQSVFSWLRFGADRASCVAVISNLTPVERHGYRLGLPYGGRWREIFNSNAGVYGGTGSGNMGAVQADGAGNNGKPASAEIFLPALATIFLLHDPV